jgi:hypothetical protein
MPAASDVLALTQGVRGQRAVSFQFIERGTDPTYGFAAVEKLAATGKWLAGIGGDLYYFNAPASFAPDPTFVRNYAIPYVQAGGLATLCVSMPNPATGGGLTDTRISGTDIIKPGTPTNTAFTAMLAKIGDCLAPAAQAGIPLILRPFHELNGDWFWWGNLDDATMATLWRQVHDYLTVTRGFTNLLFCFCVNAGVSSGIPLNAARYPGDAYVDTIGLDAYTSQPTQLAADVTMLTTRFPTKPIWLSEFGSGSPTGGDTSFSMATLIAALKLMPQIWGWQNWWSANTGTGWGIELEQTGLSSFFTDPYVAFRGDFGLGTPIDLPPALTSAQKATMLVPVSQAMAQLQALQSQINSLP